MAGVYGGGLANFGMGEQSQAMGELGQAAEDEKQRNIYNSRMATANKGGMAQLGGMLGAVAGNALAPGVGGVIGGMLGGMAGRIF